LLPCPWLHLVFDAHCTYEICILGWNNSGALSKWSPAALSHLYDASACTLPGGCGEYWTDCGAHRKCTQFPVSTDFRPLARCCDDSFISSGLPDASRPWCCPNAIGSTQKTGSGRNQHINRPQNVGNCTQYPSYPGSMSAAGLSVKQHRTTSVCGHWVRCGCHPVTSGHYDLC
jgi:hypothetical protein